MDEPTPAEEASLTPSSSHNFTPPQHKEKDQEVTQDASILFGEKQELSETLECMLLLQCIVKHSDGKLHVAFTDNKKALDLIRENPKLASALKKAWKDKKYDEIRESELLTVPRLGKDELVEQTKATENAWTAQYRGEAPAAFSSGTGKSRMIEELSKAHLVIPVNLRGSYETGYPPPDKKARAYLSGTTSQMEARVHAEAFLRAVFKEASNLITKLRKTLPKHMDNQIVDLFSKYMSEGMSWNSHGDKRQSFYDKVVLAAVKLEEETKQAFATNKSGPEEQLTSVGICEAFKELIMTFSPVGRRQANLEPLVILAFDEVRTLAQADNNLPRSHFSELRRVLRALRNEPLFSLFLTTTGNVNALVPSSRKDLSGRMQSQALSDTCPFAEVGFDHFAFKDQFNLRVVTGDEHISHFGRPLWATRYDGGFNTIKSGIIQFAALKLRAGRPWPGDPLNPIEKLACLAQRLPIEFHSVTYASKVNELQLVEGHMRILLRLDAGFESLTTVSASEPLLSEAAYWMMNSDTTFKAAETLKSCLDGYAIHKGDRGELLVMLLFTLARDRAIGPPDVYGRPHSGRRWCSVPDFMHALFKFEHHSASDASLTDLFAKSKIFFNHWVKVHQYALVNVQYIAQLMRRGAALLCATNQAGIDGIIPFLLEGNTIFPNNIGFILWQVKNDSKFTHKPQRRLFKAMDPYALGILNPGDNLNIPIIRIIFALDSKTPCLTRVDIVPSASGGDHVDPDDGMADVESTTSTATVMQQHGGAGNSKQDGFKSCDFWVGGISPTVFSPVGDHDASIWMALLQAAYGWEDVYKTNLDGLGTNNVEEGLRRSMNPGTAQDECHWENWADFTAMGNIKENEDSESGESMDED
ncbi:hypothetical protein APHAL10511_000717 [Amanita phalloides]|nr:hypothetical protein APHAL10511_000717 [Amanita phalloides]